MAEAEADPVAARWLPQQVYVGLAPPPDTTQDPAAGLAEQQQQQQQPRRAEWRPQAAEAQPPAAAVAAVQLADGQVAAPAAQHASSNGNGGSGQQPAEGQGGASPVQQQQLRKVDGGYDPLPAVARLHLQVNGVVLVLPCVHGRASRHGCTPACTHPQLEGSMHPLLHTQPHP